MKKFRTWYDTGIEEVKVTKETAHYVTVVEPWMGKSHVRRDAKRSEHGYNYFDAWQAAKDFLIDRENNEIATLMRQVEQHQATRNKIQEMKQP